MEAEFRKHFTGKTVRNVIRLVRGRNSCKRVWGGAYLDIAAFVYIKVRLRLHLLLLMGGFWGFISKTLSSYPLCL